MAKKKTSTSKSSPKAGAKGGRAAASKKPAPKTSKKAATSRSPSSKKTTKKTTKKAGKKITKKTTKKAPAKSAAGKPAKAATKKPEKKADTKKTSKKSTKPSSKAAPPPAPPPPPPPPPPPANDKNTKGGDGPNRPSRPKRPKPPAAVMPEGIGGLLSPGGPAPKPLISSSDRVEAQVAAEAEKYPTKSPFNKRELEKFRQTLLQKRAQVLAEVTGLEGDALTGGGSGNLSHTPQHMADAGSDAADQTLSLDLAAAERNLIKEIDAALKRIADGVFGLCVATGKPIRTERLAELPWARYSIDAARQLEGRR